MTRHHLTDTELLGLHFDRRAAATSTSTSPRVRDLPGARQAPSRSCSTTWTSATASETDALFGPEALARQQARIMGRVAQECRSARIISFPAASPPPVRHARTGTRWVAAAVAAGVILGIVGEHVTHRITRTPYQGRSFQAPESQVAAQPVRAVTVRTVSASDDEFYGQVELAFGSAGAGGAAVARRAHAARLGRPRIVLRQPAHFPQGSRSQARSRAHPRRELSQRPRRPRQAGRLPLQSRPAHRPPRPRIRLLLRRRPRRGLRLSGALALSRSPGVS